MVVIFVKILYWKSKLLCLYRLLIIKYLSFYPIPWFIFTIQFIYFCCKYLPKEPRKNFILYISPSYHSSYVSSNFFWFFFTRIFPLLTVSLWVYNKKTHISNSEIHEAWPAVLHNANLRKVILKSLVVGRGWEEKNLILGKISNLTYVTRSETSFYWGKRTQEKKPVFFKVIFFPFFLKSRTEH